MQKQSIFFAGLMMTIGSMAQAAPASPALLGEVDGILSYCEAIDRHDGDKFEKLEKSYSQGLSHHDLEALEKNPDYRSNFNLLQSIFRGMPADEALQLCRGAI